MYFSLVKNEKSVKHPGIKLTLHSLLIFFLFAESACMFIPQSQGNTQFGLGDAVWTIFYAKLRNEKKYRDENIEGRLSNEKKKVFFLGDSFTYGNGIKNPEDRFSNIVSEKVSVKGYEIFNLGKGNSDTRNEFIRLAQFGCRPDIVVLQYYYNDIDGVRLEHDKTVAKKKISNKIAFKTGIFVLKTSFFLNFVAVNLAKFATSFQSVDFKKQIVLAYHNAAIVQEHLADLQHIIDYCKSNRTKLYVLFIPDMREPSFTEKECYPPIEQYLDKNNISSINIYNEIKNLTIEERVVSSTDAHANELVQKIIAKKILQNVKEFELHARTNLGLPIPEITLERVGASAVVLSNSEGKTPTYNGIEEVLKNSLTDVRIFGKPTTRPYRRMALVLSYDKVGADVQKIKDRAISLAKKITIH